jgi:large subunit ribosomal protein L4
MQLEVKDRGGTKVRAIDVDDAVFGIKPHKPVVHQAMVAHRANRRRGTHKTKTRGEVRGSTAKLFRQKGTGRARQGSIRAPHRRGGGIVFGPRPRSYDQALPKRVRRLAVRSMLSAKTADGTLQVIDKLSFDAPKTKEIVGVLSAFGFDRSALIVTDGKADTVKQSVSNLPKIKWLPAAYLNTLDLLSHRSLLITEDAVRVVESLWGGERATKRRAPVPGMTADHG